MEFALVLPFLAMAMLLVVQVALVARDHIRVQHAAREGARAASVNRDPAYAVRIAKRTVPAAEVRVGPRGAIGEPIAVEVTYVSRTDLPLIGALLPDPELSARVVMRVER